MERKEKGIVGCKRRACSREEEGRRGGVDSEFGYDGGREGDNEMCNFCRR